MINNFLYLILLIFCFKRFHNHKYFSNYIYDLPIIFGFALTSIGMLCYNLDISPINLNSTRQLYINSNSLNDAFITSLIFVFGLIITLKKPQESNFYQSGNYFHVLSIVVIFISSFIINGTELVLSGGYGTENFKTERWGGWALLFILSAANLISNINKYKIVKPILIFVSLYWFFAGNRSEILMLIVFLVFYKKMDKKISMLKIILPSTILLFLFDLLGRLRSAGITLQSIINNISNPTYIKEGTLSISTVGSSFYTLIATQAIAKENGFQYGKTYLAYLINSVPSFIPQAWDKVKDIAWFTEEAGTIGGSLLYSEAYLNFGNMGVLIFGSIFGYFWRIIWVKSNKSSLTNIFLISLIIYFQRYFLYGFVYLWKTILLFSSLHFLSFLIKKSK